MALERVGAIVGRLAGTRPLRRPVVHAIHVDAGGYRLDCCDACPIFARDRRGIVAHRLTCDTFDATVMASTRERIEVIELRRASRDASA